MESGLMGCRGGSYHKGVAFSDVHAEPEGSIAGSEDLGRITHLLDQTGECLD